jgi:hypothetical protein
MRVKKLNEITIAKRARLNISMSTIINDLKRRRKLEQLNTREQTEKNVLISFYNFIIIKPKPVQIEI